MRLRVRPGRRTSRSCAGSSPGSRSSTGAAVGRTCSRARGVRRPARPPGRHGLAGRPPRGRLLAAHRRPARRHRPEPDRRTTVFAGWFAAHDPGARLAGHPARSGRCARSRPRSTVGVELHRPVAGRRELQGHPEDRRRPGSHRLPRPPLGRTRWRTRPCTFRWPRPARTSSPTPRCAASSASRWRSSARPESASPAATPDGRRVSMARYPPLRWVEGRREVPGQRARATAERLAEGVGFEPTVSCPTHAFQACRFGRSRIPPGARRSYRRARRIVRRAAATLRRGPC